MDRMLRDKKIIALFITPVLIIFSCLIPIPLILSLALGFFRWNLLDLPRFVGLDNFIRLFTMDDIFLQSIKNTLQYVLYTAVMQIPIAVIFAAMLTRGKRFEKLFVNLIFMPVALSGTAVALMFLFHLQSYRCFERSLDCHWPKHADTLLAGGRSGPQWRQFALRLHGSLLVITWSFISRGSPIFHRI
ncbi:MAG: carbohydrate ABC transporter permease [Escherichia coli]